MTKREAFGTDSSENILTSIKFPHENEPNDHHLRNKAIFLRTLPQCSEEEQVIPWYICRDSPRKKSILHELKKRDRKNTSNTGQLLHQ